MRKSILTLIISLIMPLLSIAQKGDKIILPIDSSTNEVTYTAVVKVDSTSKDELYSRAKEWFAKTYNSARKVIDMDDKASGKIIGKGVSEGRYSFMLTRYTFFTNYTISVFVKDGRYKYEIIPKSVEESSPTSISDGAIMFNYYVDIYNKDKGIKLGAAKKIILNMDDKSSALIQSLKSAMITKSDTGKSKDDF
ncbi:DUF4468 domain-containing protein [Mucilaginibacter endophyticus]|uniref:DUF4468 domain-containing protein n=1 Tax=Mucilaginibacter endophyticus TaxID=2675003 RepID=UPI000E0D36EC|nr:DUF4468 domain-containing protein [Mucilaginibacter endophyticus]